MKILSPTPPLMPRPLVIGLFRVLRQTSPPPVATPPRGQHRSLAWERGGREEEEGGAGEEEEEEVALKGDLES